MSEDRKIQLGVAVDSSEAKKGFDEVKQGARDMAQSVSQSGKQAGDGMGSIGSGGDVSSQKIDRSTKSIINSIQRTTAAMEAGSRGSSSYFENLAKQRGANVDVLKPYLEQLDAAAAKQNVASASLGEMGMTAKQTAWAIRGVPAQFTDIFVSIASGQRPMMVMLQQGGQLKDMFGGIGNAAKALGGYALGLINPFTIAATAVAGLGAAYYQGSQEADSYVKALVMTGNAAGTTSNELQQMAQRIAASTGSTQSASADALAQLSATGKVAASNLTLVGEAAINMERATGTAVSETVKQFEELGRSPVEASLKLNNQYNYLTASIYEQIKALEDEGKTAEAAALAQKAYADALNDRAGQIKQNLGAIESAWKGLKDAAKGAWDAMLDIGRQGDPLQNAADKVASLRKSIAEMESGPYGGSFLSKSRADTQREQLAAAEKTLESLKKEVSEKEKSQRVTEEATRAEQARIAWLKEGDKYLSQQVKMEAEIAKARNQGAAAGASSVEIEKRIAEIRKQYDKPKTSVDSGAKNDYAQIMSAQLDMAKNAARSEIEIIKEKVAQQVMTEQQGVEQVYAIQQQAAAKQAELLNKQLAGTKDIGDREKIRAQIQQLGNEAAQAGEKYQTAVAKISAADLKNTQDYMKTVGDETAALLEKAKAAEAENNTIGMTAEQLAYLTSARYDEQIAAKQATIDSIGNVEGREAEVALIEEQINALERLKSAAVQKPLLQANKKAAEDAAREWQKSTDEINRSLTDALLRGFESGKGFAQNFVDTMKNMFNTMVLRPVISAVLSPVSGAISTGMGAMGLSGAAGGTDLLGMGMQGASMYSGLTSGTGFLGGIGNFLGLGPAATTAMTTGMAFAPAATSAFAPVAGYGTSAMLGIAPSATPLIADSIVGIGSSAATGLGTATTGLTTATTGLTGALAAVPVWGWAAMAALAVFGSGMFDSKGGPKTEGDYFGTIGPDGKLTQSDTATFGGDAYTGHSADEQLAGMAPALGKSIASAITSLGGDASGLGINFGYNTDPEGDAPDNIMAGVTDASGNLLYQSWRDVERGQASAELEKEVPRMILASLQGVELSALFDPLLDSLGNISDLTDEQVNAALGNMQVLTDATTDSVAKVFGEAFDISAFEALTQAGETTLDAFVRLNGVFASTNSVVDSIGGDTATAFGAVGLESTEARQSLIDMAGGIQALSASASSFRANFYTSAENTEYQRTMDMYTVQSAADAWNVAHPDAAIGSIPASSYEFRSLVETVGSDLSSETNREAYTALMDVQESFARLYPLTEQQVQQVSSGGGGGSSATTAEDPWKSAADAIVDAIKDLQSSLIETGPDSYARLQAQFAIDVAMAKAGDVNAAEALPDLGKSLAEAGKDFSRSAVEQAMLTASIIESLDSVLVTRGISVPSFDVGTNYVPHDMLAMVHEGEAIIPKEYNVPDNGNASLVAEIRVLRQEVAALRASADATAKSTRDTARTLDSAANGGQPISTVAV